MKCLNMIILLDNSLKQNPQTLLKRSCNWKQTLCKKVNMDNCFAFADQTNTVILINDLNVQENYCLQFMYYSILNKKT